MVHFCHSPAVCRVMRGPSLGLSTSIYISCPAVCSLTALSAPRRGRDQGGNGNSLGAPRAVVSVYKVPRTPLLRPLGRGDVGAGFWPDSWFLGGSSLLCPLGVQLYWYKFPGNVMFLLETTDQLRTVSACHLSQVPSTILPSIPFFFSSAHTALVCGL